ncbi:OB-fold protein [Serratia marcescens]
MIKRLFWVSLFSLFSTATHASETLTDNQVDEIIKPKDERVFLLYMSALKNEFTKGTMENEIPTKESPEQKIYSAKDLDSAYKKNEITATEKYKGKTVRIKDIAQKIGLNALDNAFVRAGANLYGDVVIMSVDKNSESVKKMSTGDKIDMVCRVGGYNLDTLYLEKCTTSEEEARRSVSLSLEGGDTYHVPQSKSFLSMVVAYKANEEELSKSCQISAEQCIKTLNGVTSQTGYKQKMKQFIEKNGILAWSNSKKLPDYLNEKEIIFRW